MSERIAPEIETLRTKVVYQNRWMRVRKDVIKRQDGTEGLYGVVEKPDFVAIAPIEDDGSLRLVQQYRYPVGVRFWELPQGSWEQVPNVDPSELAREELREETGPIASQMIHVGHIFQTYGYATQGCHVFLAYGLRRGPARQDPEEQDLVTRRFAFSDVVSMIQNGDVKDATTIAAPGLIQFKGFLAGPGTGAAG